MKKRFDYTACYLIALLISSSIYAQTQEEKPRAVDVTTAPVAVANAHKHAREADARHCLDQKSEREIIRCAEAYRYRGAR